jgi:superfamily I DNA and/or RNA helicase
MKPNLLLPCLNTFRLSLRINKIAFIEEDREEDADFTIGVIVTYKAQEDLIKSIINDTKIESLKHIQISTVDAFQGAERDVIILG